MSKTVCSCPSFWVVWCCVAQDGKNETRCHCSVRPNCTSILLYLWYKQFRMLPWGSSHKGFTADGLGHLVNLRKPDLHFRHPQQLSPVYNEKQIEGTNNINDTNDMKDVEILVHTTCTTLDRPVSLDLPRKKKHHTSHHKATWGAYKRISTPASTSRKHLRPRRTGQDPTCNAIKKHWTLRTVMWKDEPLTWGLGIVSARSIIFCLCRVNKPTCFNANLAPTMPQKTLIPDRSNYCAILKSPSFSGERHKKNKLHGDQFIIFKQVVYFRKKEWIVGVDIIASGLCTLSPVVS